MVHVPERPTQPPPTFEFRDDETPDTYPVPSEAIEVLKAYQFLSAQGLSIASFETTFAATVELLKLKWQRG